MNDTYVNVINTCIHIFYPLPLFKHSVCNEILLKFRLLMARRNQNADVFLLAVKCVHVRFITIWKWLGDFGIFRARIMLIISVWLMKPDLDLWIGSLSNDWFVNNGLSLCILTSQINHVIYDRRIRWLKTK